MLLILSHEVPTDETLSERLGRDTKSLTTSHRHLAELKIAPQQLAVCECAVISYS